jgi:hypothetical protein
MTGFGPGCVKTQSFVVSSKFHGCLSMPRFKQIDCGAFGEVGFLELFLLRRFHTAWAAYCQSPQAVTGQKQTYKA